MPLLKNTSKWNIKSTNKNEIGKTKFHEKSRYVNDMLMVEEDAAFHKKSGYKTDLKTNLHIKASYKLDLFTE